MAAPQAAPPPPPRDEEDGGVEDALSAEVFAPYVARALTGELAALARPHPGDIAEAASLAAVAPSAAAGAYPLAASLGALAAVGRLSALQLEGVAAAGAAHLKHLPNGERAGFFIGDGTGVGEFSYALGRPVEAENILETNQPTNQPTTDNRPPPK